jgi:ribosomal protein S15P/S13E
MSSYSGVPVEISSILSITFPVDKLVDEFVASVFNIKVDFEKQSKEEIQKIIYEDNNVPTVDEPGLATLIDTFIRMIIKCIGSFAQQIFILTELVKKIKEALKNPTSKSNAEYLASIPKKIKELIKEVKTFFADTAKWIMDKFLGALSKINIPIPSFDFNILGFKLTIPKIDNKGALNDDSKLNIPKHEDDELKDIKNKIEELNNKISNSNKNIGDDIDNITDKLQPDLDKSKKKLDDGEKKLKDNNDNIKKLENKKIRTVAENKKLKLLKEENKKLTENVETYKKDYESKKVQIDEQMNKIENNLNTSDTETELKEAKNELKSKLGENPVSAYTEKIKEMVINIIKFPVDFVFNLFKQLLKALVKIFSFDFGEFEKLIQMLKPNIDSVGLLIGTVLDGFIDGFSTLYKAAKDKFGNIKENIEEVVLYLKDEGNKILGRTDSDENKEKLNQTISYFVVGVNIITAFPILFLNLIVELFNYALNPIGIKIII